MTIVDAAGGRLGDGGGDCQRCEDEADRRWGCREHSVQVDREVGVQDAIRSRDRDRCDRTGGKREEVAPREHPCPSEALRPPAGVHRDREDEQSYNSHHDRRDQERRGIAQGLEEQSPYDRAEDRPARDRGEGYHHPLAEPGGISGIGE